VSLHFLHALDKKSIFLEPQNENFRGIISIGAMSVIQSRILCVQGGWIVIFEEAVTFNFFTKEEQQMMHVSDSPIVFSKVKY